MGEKRRRTGLGFIGSDAVVTVIGTNDKDVARTGLALFDGSIGVGQPAIDDRERVAKLGLGDR